MDGTLKYILEKYNIGLYDKSPIQLNISRKDLASLFYELGFNVGAEIGVEQGIHSEILCQSIPDLHLFCIDPWDIELHQHHSFAAITQKDLDRYRIKAIRRLLRYNCDIIQKTSDQAVDEFYPNSLDFVYIDGNHNFDYVVNDIINWSKIVRPSGIIAGHDYRPNDVEGINFHVKIAVDAYVEVHKIHPWFLVLDDGTPSWFWVKQ